MNESPIEWTDLTVNPVKGCTDAVYKNGCVRRGCKRCYARRIAARMASNPTQPKYRGLALFSPDKEPKWTGELRLDVEELDKIRGLKRPRRLFVESMGDIAHEGVSEDWYGQIFEALVDSQPVGHAFYLLTKRPAHHAELLRAMLKRFGADAYWRVMRQAVVMTTLEDGHAVNDFLDDLLTAPACRFGVSAEPLAGGISLKSAMHPFRALATDRSLREAEQRPDVRRWYAMRLRLEEIATIIGSDELYRTAQERTPWLLPDQDDQAIEESSRMLLNQMKGDDRRLALLLEDKLQRGRWELRLDRLVWVIGGGESGFEAAPSHPIWFRRLRDEAELLGAAFHFKQWGAWGPLAEAYAEDAPELVSQLIGRHHLACVELDGSIPHEEYSDGRFRSDYQPGLRSWWMVKRTKADNGRTLDGVQHDGAPSIIGGRCHADA